MILDIEGTIQLAQVVVELARRNENQRKLLSESNPRLESEIDRLTIENRLLRSGITPGPSPELQAELDSIGPCDDDCGEDCIQRTKCSCPCSGWCRRTKK